MTISDKNFQGFTIFGLNFDTNYGEKINACCQFDFMGYEISISTGACWPSRNIYPVGPFSILVTNIESGKETEINGSVEDAIKYVLQQTSLPQTPVVMLENNETEVTIKMKDFGGNEGAADSLYNNPSYDDSFKVETKSGDIVNVTLDWEQGRGNNYRFTVVNDTRYYLSDEITKVEVL
jgi:hypothetical protein